MLGGSATGRCGRPPAECDFAGVDRLVPKAVETEEADYAEVALLGVDLK